MENFKALSRYAVLIPTKNRPKALSRLLSMCPALNRPSTFVGVDVESVGQYDVIAHGSGNNVTWIRITNPGGYTSVAREQLRKEATRKRFNRYVLADDNCEFNDNSLFNLLRAQQIYASSIVAGFHPTAPHFHAEQIENTTVMTDGLSTYQQVGMIYWCIPHALYNVFTYPEDCYFDDVYFILWAMTRRHTNFRCCQDAPFNKHLHQPGGTGTVAERIRKRGIGFARLATDFPQWMTTGILQTRVPYKKIAEAIYEGKSSF